MSKKINHDQVFFFTLDFRATKKAIKDLVDKRNHELLQEIQLHNNNLPVKPRNCVVECRKAKQMGEERIKIIALREEIRDYNKALPVPPRSYQAECFKACHEASVWAVLEMYAGYLKRVGDTGQTDLIFKTNHEAIRHRKHDRMDRITAYRHILKAIEFGIFTEKTFLGSNTSFILNWNPNLIVFNRNEALNQHLIAVYKSAFQKNVSELPLEATKRLFSWKSTLSSLGGSPFTVASCNHTYAILKQEHNNNIDSGVVSISFLTFANATLKNHATNELIFSFSQNNGCQEPGEAPPSCAAPPDLENPVEMMLIESEKTAEKVKIAKSIEFNNRKAEHHMRVFAEQTYIFMISVLFSWRKISDFESNLAIENLYTHLKRYVNKQKNKDDILSLLIHAKADLMGAIMVSKNYANNQLDKEFFKNPVTYSQTDKEFGINKALICYHSPGYKEQGKLNAEYNSHHKLLIQCYNKFLKDQSTYHSSAQRLGKFRNKCWVEYFNGFVAGVKKFSAQEFTFIYQSQYKNKSQLQTPKNN